MPTHRHKKVNLPTNQLTHSDVRCKFLWVSTSHASVRAVDVIARGHQQICRQVCDSTGRWDDFTFGELAWWRADLLPRINMWKETVSRSRQWMKPVSIASSLSTWLRYLSGADARTRLSADVCHALTCQKRVLTGWAAADAVYWQPVIGDATMYCHALTIITNNMQLPRPAISVSKVRIFIWHKNQQSRCAATI